MRTTTFTSHKCVTALFAVILGCIQWISGETIVIAHGTDNRQLKEDDSNYKLECLITNLESPAIAWSKDDNLLYWSSGTITDLDMTGEYRIQEIYLNPTTQFILTFTQVRNHHYGNYKCFTATGDTENFNVVQSSAVYISVIPSPFTSSVTDAPRPTLPEGPYFPSSEWPTCYPQNDIKALIYSQLNLTCVSTPGNPLVEVNIYDPSNGKVIQNEDTITINTITNRIERIYTYQVIPTDNMDQFYCQIIDGNGMFRQCTMGKLEIGLFQYDRYDINQGATTIIIQCLAGSRNGIHWSTEPPIEPSRLEMTGDELWIHDVEMADNGTNVICHVDGYNLQDQTVLIVYPNSTLDMKPTTVPSTSTIQNTTTLITPRSLPIPVIAAIGGGGGLLLIALIFCIIAICCCCRCRNRESDIKVEDGETTRISTGYMWDKELSHMVQESPRPSPKLTNNNHAHARQVLKDPDEIDPSMSPSLAYALANHSDDELDSEDGDLKKPVSAAYETVDLNPVGRVLEHGASMHSNLYASTAIVAPTPPTSSNPSIEFPPQYAVPDKNKYPSSRADDNAIPTESLYAIVHPDPENPIVRATLRQRATEGHVNAAYDPNEEGFVDNDIYVPAGI